MGLFEFFFQMFLIKYRTLRIILGFGHIWREGGSGVYRGQATEPLPPPSRHPLPFDRAIYAPAILRVEWKRGRRWWGLHVVHKGKEGQIPNHRCTLFHNVKGKLQMIDLLKYTCSRNEFCSAIEYFDIGFLCLIYLLKFIHVCKFIIKTEYILLNKLYGAMLRIHKQITFSERMYTWSLLLRFVDVCFHTTQIRA